MHAKVGAPLVSVQMGSAWVLLVQILVLLLRRWATSGKLFNFSGP